MLTEVGEDHGVPAAALLAGSGLSADDLRRSETIVPALAELQVARNLVHALGDRPGLGADAGARYRLVNTGMLAFAMLASPTVGDGLTIALRNAGMTSAFVRPALAIDNRRALFSFHADAIPADVRTFFLERDATAAVALIAGMLGERPLPGTRMVLDLPGASVRSVADALATVGEVTSDPGVVSRLEMPLSLWRRPLPQADDESAALCERQCRALLERRRHRAGRAGAIRARLLRDPGRIPSLAEIARELNADPRTVRRWLTAEGTSFRALLDEARQALGQALVAEPGLTIAEVAARTGFAETASFSRAFTRWTGQTPTAWRASRPADQPPERDAATPPGSSPSSAGTRG